MDTDFNSGLTEQQLMKSVMTSPNVKCKCGSKVFHEAHILKKVSALVSPTGRDMIYPIPVYVCDKCGEIPNEFLDNTNASAILGEDTKEIENTLNL